MKTNLFGCTLPALTTVTVFLAMVGMAGNADAEEYLFFSSDIHNAEDFLIDQVDEYCETFIGPPKTMRAA